MDEPTRRDGISRRRLLKSSAAGMSAGGLAGCTAADLLQDTPVPPAPSQDMPAPELDLDTLEADTEFGTLQAERAANSYVGWIDDGQAIGVAPLEEVGAGETHDHEEGIVVHLYDRENLAIMIGEIDADGAATLDSEEQSDFEATVDLTIETDAASGTVTIQGDSTTPFTADAATGDAGVYWAHGTDEEPDASGDWVVLPDGRQWGCVCVPPFNSPCCTLHR